MNRRIFFILKRYINEIYFKENKRMSFVIFCLSILKVVSVLVPPIYILRIIDQAIPEQDSEKIILYSIIVILFTIFDAILGIFLEKNYNYLSKNVVICYQKRCLRHLFRLNGKYYTDSSIGEKLTMIMSDVYQIQNLSSPIIFNFISDVITAIVMLLFLAYIKIDMLLVVLFLLPIIYYSQKYFQRQGMEKANVVREAQSKLTDILEVIITNTFSCILCNGEQYFFQKYNRIIDDTENQNIASKMIVAKNNATLNFLSTLFTIIILGIGSVKVMYKSLSIGGLIAFNMYSQKLVIPVLKISTILMTLQGLFVSLERLEKFMDEPEVFTSSKMLFCGIKEKNNKIVFQNINFSYNKIPILKNVSMLFKPNELSVIVGESGSGKSTLTLLLYRLWEIKSGMIKINDIDYRQYDTRYLRDSISIVGQESFLFNDTILNNIMMGKVSDMDSVIECAKTACIHDFIMSLPNQYRSFVGDKGVKLSGGEKQRICIARALLKNTPILILDEATSALDQLTEKKLLDNLTKKVDGKIFILITHRLHSIVEANTIFVLKNGEIWAKGSHEDLMNNSVYYKQLYERDSMLDV